MAVTVTRYVRADPAEAWAALSDVSKHAGLVPFTRILTDPERPLGQGWRFIARTEVLGRAFDDRMWMQVWQPPEAPGPADAVGTTDAVATDATGAPPHHPRLKRSSLPNPSQSTTDSANSSGAGVFHACKAGPVLTGWARLEVRPGAEPGVCVAQWYEQIRLPISMPRVLNWAADRVTGLMFGRVLDGLLARAGIDVVARRGAIET